MSIDASGSAGSRSASLQQVLSDLGAADAGPGPAGPAGSAAGSFMELWDDLDLAPGEDGDEDEDDGDAARGEQQPLL